jgi:hypothetical protein
MTTLRVRNVSRGRLFLCEAHLITQRLGLWEARKEKAKFLPTPIVLEATDVRGITACGDTAAFPIIAGIFRPRESALNLAVRKRAGKPETSDTTEENPDE